MFDNPARLSSSKRLASAVYDEIKARILTGRYAPGEWLSVDRLSEEFEVSRQPVMEAMRRLAGDWLVEILPQVGSRVASHEPQAMLDFISSMVEMEMQVASFAAERRTQEQVVRLVELLERIVERPELDTENELLGRAYHNLVLEMAHSSAMARLCEQMWDFSTFASEVVNRDRERVSVRRRATALKRLTDAISEQNAEEARHQVAVWLSSRTGVPMARKKSA
jgi:DNA-binding GntR family transcriptional regulator